MLQLIRQTCYYVPRKLRGLFIMSCFVFTGLSVLFILHLAAVLFGVTTHEVQLSELRIEEAIPKWQEAANQKFLAMDRKMRQSEFANWTAKVHRSSKNVYDKLFRVRSKLKALKQNISDLSFKSSCGRFYPKVLLFMRIPKCASTSFVEVAKSLSVTFGNFVFHFNPSGAYNWDDKVQNNVAQFINQQILTNSKLLYARHFYHVDFSKHFDFKYITIVRDPISRIVSSYLYYHFSSKPHIQAILDPTHKNESLEACLMSSHEGCYPNLMTKYFCGHERICDTGSDEALSRAKRNIIETFAVVGIMEDMEGTFSLYKRVLPDYFAKLNIKKALLKRNSNERTVNISLQTQQKIKELNSADVLLYDFVKARFHKQLLHCGV